jgi:hypothetical protein
VERNLKAGQNPPRSVAPVKGGEEEEEEEEGKKRRIEEVRNWRGKCKDR